LDKTNPSIEDVVVRLREKGVIPDTYEDLQGEIQDVPVSTRVAVLKSLGFPRHLNRSTIETWPTPVLDVDEETKCYLPTSLTGKGVWGISVQLYELRSKRNWGIGDFEDLKSLCTIAAEAGAAFIGLNPLHALFLANPDHCSPYSPSNRRFLNPLYLAVDKIPGFHADLVDTKKLAKARASDAVDYPLVARIKLTALRKLWRHWNEDDSSEAKRRKQEFSRYKNEGGEALLGHALFEALSEEMVAHGHGSGWQSWPEEYRDRESLAVEKFAEEKRDAVDFHVWLQWLTATQLEEASAHARAAGMPIGLYLDFAVGEVPDGSSTWSEPQLVLPGLQVGAPPDAFSAKGQDWGLVPISPVPLLDRTQSHYKDLVDRTARFAGALRLDHALGLWQFFLIPEGETAAAGGYLRYPFADVMAHLADVSQERNTIIIGEDLGNVPEGFRPALKKADVLGYRVLYFEDVGPELLAEADEPSLSLACLSTHDLPPLLGWWAGDDIAFSLEQAWCDSDAAVVLRTERQKRKSAMLHLAAEAGLIEKDAIDAADGDELPEAAVIGLHRLLARSNSMIVAARLADMVGERRSTNIPGTSEEYPNWRLKLAVPLEELAETPLFQAIASAQRTERPS
jgi:4-alpha-glucanotransferase